ncbi:PREDICTED: ribonuclease-like [Thamnophis sirtalis]|uniref:Ribonuclease-like n=1 Tax=Thamnophis sirtalis TaxID=35019 RepID=A0A6I9WXI8_9SAUR|nr:PREDICTED: ribonuclease-like [Thamnophis sirtalis]
MFSYHMGHNGLDDIITAMVHLKSAMLLVLKKWGCPVFFLLMAPCMIASQSSSENPRHKKFLREHQDFPETKVVGQNYCVVMMLQRGMSRPCKTTNSFVHAPSNQLKDICSWAGTYYRRALRLSKSVFPVTTCNLQGTSQGQCRYSSQTGQRQILINCDSSGWPVHFEESNFM